MEYSALLQRNHQKLRRLYYYELFIIIGLLFSVTFTLFTLDYFIVIAFNFPFPAYFILLGGFVITLLFSSVYYPLRARRLQKRLLVSSYAIFKKAGIKLIPNPQPLQTFSYPTLLAAAFGSGTNHYTALTRYEFNGRLIHMLHYTGDKSAVIIHIPARKNPYYLQIHNGKFMLPKTYDANDIVKIAFVSPHNLHYYATSSATNVKIYLRKTLEVRFNNLLAFAPYTYQYVLTYNDEFLRVSNVESLIRLRLTATYAEDYYKSAVDTLKTLQQLITIMLEGGK